jgi:hypothetical protein
MGYVIGFFLAIFALYIALWLIVAAIVYLVVPALLILVTVGMLGGVVFAAAVAVLTLAGVGSWGARTITPDDVVRGAVTLPWRKKTEPFAPDRAWPSYLVAQWRTDLVKAWEGARAALLRVLRRLNGFTKTLEYPFAWTPLLVFLYGGWAAVVVGALAGGLVIVTLGALVLGPAWVGAVAVIGLARSVDLVVRRRRKASGSCPSCYFVTMLPAYGCDHCQELHRDLRPGWLGAVWHKCWCGTKLPTTVLRAAKRLGSRCPRCGQSLRTGAALLTDIRLPVFGPMSAGKTRLVYAGLVALRDRLAADGAQMTFDDPTSGTTFGEAIKIIESGDSTQKTVQGPLPRPVSARVTSGKRAALLHLFDAAGEYYVDRDDNSKLEFLDTAQGLVFVVDPFSVRWVTDQLTGARNERLVAAHPADEDPERVYHVTVRRLAEYGVDTARRHLAVAVVKSDLLIDLPLAADLRTGNAREWLNQAGLDNLVLSAERDFAEVRYFAVASVAGKASESLSPANPFLWLMSEVGFVPGQGNRPVPAN